MKWIFFLVLLFFALIVSAQRKWEFKTKIVGNEYYLLEGKIDDKYPITMYLEETGNFCPDESNNSFSGRELAGWYYYNKVKKKIPIVGIKDRQNSSNYLELFVPKNILESLNSKTCDIIEYREKFIIQDCCSFSEMKWQSNPAVPFQPVRMKESHPHSHQSSAFLSFEIGGIEMMNINITKRSKVNSISEFKVLASKKIGNNFYSIIIFSEASLPGSAGSGSCGAGMEEYLGFIHINSKLELQKFNFQHARSCLKNLEEYYDYDKEHPERGILKVNHYHDGPYD